MNEQDKLRINELVVKAMDGELTVEEGSELNRFVASEPCAAQYYQDCIDIFWGMYEGNGLIDVDQELTTMLKTMEKYEKEAEIIQHPVPEQRPSKYLRISPTGKTRFGRRELLNALVRIAALFMFAALLISLDRYLNRPMRSGEVIAYLGETVDAEWERHGHESLESGMSLQAGTLALSRGLAELALKNGAKLILEGPVEIELENSSRIILKHGRLVADVEASEIDRFVVRTENFTVVDYGTEFGVAVDEQGNMLTHVFKGNVELREGSNPLKYERSLRLTAGQSGEASTQGTLTRKKINSWVFVRKEQFITCVHADKGSAYHRWQAYSYRIRRNPFLMAYYTFEQDDKNPQQIKNIAGVTSDRLHGYLTDYDSSPQWVVGRWPQKSALKFNRGKQQSVTVPADPAICTVFPLTIAAWINCPDVKDAGIIVASRKEVVNYQLGIINPAFYEGYRVQFARHQDELKHFYSKKLERFSAGWNHVCVTHDNQQIRYYLNGKLFSTEKREFQPSSVSADLVIGTNPLINYKSQSFNGIIDELMIFNCALTDEEIREMYTAGKPDMP